MPRILTIEIQAANENRKLNENAYTGVQPGIFQGRRGFLE